MILASNSKHWLEEISELNLSQKALISSESETDFIDIFKGARSLSAHLNNTGIKENSNVGVIFSHSKEFWICINALWFLNAVPVLISTRSSKEEIIEQIKKAEIKFLLIDHEIHSKFPALNSVCTIISIDKINYLESKLLSGQLVFSKTNNAVILFTSGSSGKPKAVVHTFESLYASASSIDSEFELSSSDIWLASLPLYHIGGFMILVRALLSGSAVYFPKSLSEQEIAYAMKNSRSTHVSVVSTMLKRFININLRPDKSLRYLFLGGGSSSDELCSMAIKSGWPVVKVYGSSETCSMVTASKIEQDKISSSGKALKDNLIMIENDEILVKSRSLFKEYFNDETATKEKLKDGIYYTGDNGWIDENGFLYIKARRTDLIISGGENISVSEIESALLSNPIVKDAFAFGIPHEHWGDIICAAVVSSDKNADSLKSFLRQKIAGFKIPKQIYFVDEIPRNEMGKIKREELLKTLNLSEF